MAANGSGGSSGAPPKATATVGQTNRSAIAHPAVAAISAPRLTIPPLQPTTVRESNIRQEPSPDFRIVCTVTSGKMLDIVGYNDDRDVVWYKLRDGNWIWPILWPMRRMWLTWLRQLCQHRYRHKTVAAVARRDSLGVSRQSREMWAMKRVNEFIMWRGKNTTMQPSSIRAMGSDGFSQRRRLKRPDGGAHFVSTLYGQDIGKEGKVSFVICWGVLCGSNVRLSHTRRGKLE